jgi:hypothetical protein
MKKYYRMLDLPYDAPLSDIKQAYRDLVRIWHPDRYARDERLQKRATAKLMELNEAYKMLCSITPEESPDQQDVEPIDWSSPTIQKPTAPAKPVVPAPAQRTTRHAAQWYYGVVGISLAGVLVLLVLFTSDNRRPYEPLPFPPPDQKFAVGIALDSESPLPQAEVLRSIESAPEVLTSQQNNSRRPNTAADSLGVSRH